MPSRYYIRNFTPNYYYHIYNRGSRKQNIFEDEADFQTFIDIVKYYIKFPSGKPISRTADLVESLQVRNLSENQSSFGLTCFCLMPNHFHLLLRQKLDPNPINSIPNFMKRITITYSMYYKDKYETSGALLEGKYKNILVDNDKQLLVLTRYIHRNPIETLKNNSKLDSYKYSSYRYYLNYEQSDFIEFGEIMKIFSNTSKLNYKSFTEGSNSASDNKNIEHLMLE